MLYLVGTGTGVARLLTVRAAELLESAGMLLHAGDVPAELLARAPADAGIVELQGDAAATARMLAAAAGRGTAVRLYPGDPLSGVRGASEMAALVELGVPFEIVPGLPPETVALAFAGVAPCEGVTVARLEEGAAGALLRVDRAPDAGGAARALLVGGADPATPALLVSAPGSSAQRVVAGTLAAFAQGAGESGRAASTAGPALLVASPAVEGRWPWFESRPLFGRRIVVTRARAQAAGLASWLESQGAEPVLFPAIRVVSPPEPGELARAAAQVGGFDWVIFTSANGVERFWAALAQEGLDSRALGGVRVAAIGPATAAALHARGVRPDVVPERYVAESVVEALAATTELEGARVLLPRAFGARVVLPEGLTARGARVTEVEAYRSVPDLPAGGELRRRLAAGQIDAVTFTSSSTVQHFVEAVGVELGGAAVICIGPITAETARAQGLTVHAVAAEYTVAGLETALLAHFGQASAGAADAASVNGADT